MAVLLVELVLECKIHQGRSFIAAGGLLVISTFS